MLDLGDAGLGRTERIGQPGLVPPPAVVCISASCWPRTCVDRSSGSGMASRYQPSKSPALSRVTEKIASRLGSNANSRHVTLVNRVKTKA